MILTTPQIQHFIDEGYLVARKYPTCLQPKQGQPTTRLDTD
jgi:hypothetical protein